MHSRCLFIPLSITRVFYINFHKQTFALDNVKELWSVLRAHSSTTDAEDFQGQETPTLQTEQRRLRAPAIEKAIVSLSRGCRVELMEQK